MKTLVRFLILLLCVCAASAHAVPGAGTIMLAKLPGEKGYSILLADHRGSSRGFASFGGRLSGDTLEVAAARESAEESRMQYTQAGLLAKIEAAWPLMLGSFTVYVIEVEPILAQRMEEAPLACLGCAERMAYLWLPLAVMDELLDGRNAPFRLPDQYLPKTAETNYLWPRFVTLYRAAKPLLRALIDGR